MNNNKQQPPPTTQSTMNTRKEWRKFWLNRGCIHYIINWNAGLDCLGNKINTDPRSK